MLRMDFRSQDYLRNPATGLAALREAGPVMEVPIIGNGREIDIANAVLPVGGLAEPQPALAIHRHAAGS